MSLTGSASYKGDPREEISQLEQRIEMLEEGIERCRKLRLLARIALAVGVIWLLLMSVGVAAIAAVNIIGAIAALLGGIVLLGSNSSTWTQTERALAAAEGRRKELIETMNLRLVEDIGLSADPRP